MGVLLYWW